MTDDEKKLYEDYIKDFTVALSAVFESFPALKMGTPVQDRDSHVFRLMSNDGSPKSNQLCVGFVGIGIQENTFVAETRNLQHFNESGQVDRFLAKLKKDVVE